MNSNIKYQQVCSIGLFGDDLYIYIYIYIYSGAQYSLDGIYNNSKHMRFVLNNELYCSKLSANNRCVVETRCVVDYPMINSFY